MVEILQQASVQRLCRSVVFESDSPSPADVLRALAARPGLVALESLCADPLRGRYSIFVSDPVDRLICGPEGPDPFTCLAEWTRNCHGALESIAGCPFFGGWVGYIGYEAGRFLERLPAKARRDLPLPVAWLGLYDTAAIFDHSAGTWSVAGAQLHPPPAGRPGMDQRLDQLTHVLRQCKTTDCEPPEAPDAGVIGPQFDRQAHRRKVEIILDHIRRGDIYQANLTERFEVGLSDTPLNTYLRLRRTNRGDHAAYLNCGAFSVLCTSPELFLQVTGDSVLARPIKGTVPRSADPDVDRRQARQLLNSEKDLAELAMIVDLQRNDLGRVCRDIQADWPPCLESYDTVHHLVTNVRGVLPPKATSVDLLRACFPGGSITGCPKIRAMQIIDDLEPVARGPYCGAIGYLGLDANMQMNVAIRTVVTVGEKAYVHAGGGIVADSNPHAEAEELLAKAKGMLSALGIQGS